MMKNIYEAIDNNGDLIILTTSKKVAISTADDHFKDTAGLPILGDEHPEDTPVEDGNGKFIGRLADLTK